MLSIPDFLRADVFNRVPRFRVLLPSVAAGGHGYLLPSWGAGHSATPLVLRASDCAWYRLDVQEDWCHFVRLFSRSNGVEPAGSKKDDD